MKRKLEIGNVIIPGILALGPMAGVTDLPFRTICKDCGAEFILNAITEEIEMR